MLAVGEALEVLSARWQGRGARIAQIKGVDDTLVEQAVFVLRVFALGDGELFQRFLWLVQVAEGRTEVGAKVGGVRAGGDGLGVVG